MEKAQKLVAALQSTKLIIMLPEQNFQASFEVKDMIYAGLIAEAINSVTGSYENEE